MSKNKHHNDCYIALGSNLNNPLAQLQLALVKINQLPGTKIIKTSTFHETKPVGFIEQPDFLNAVTHVRTKLSPHSLLSALQKIELDQGRVRGDNQNGPRTLDLDILLYDHRRICTHKLTVPHPRMWQRDFVLMPLKEVLIKEYYYELVRHRAVTPCQVSL